MKSKAKDTKINELKRELLQFKNVFFEQEKDTN